MIALTGISELVQPHLEENSDRPLDITRDAALLIEGGQVVRAGPAVEVLAGLSSAEVVHRDLGGRAVVPGLVDSHTHAVFAGERLEDLARRARGETYASIAKAGGGLHTTVTATQQASVETLAEGAVPRLNRMLARGVTTVEIKSGYGLLPEQELKQLKAIYQLSRLVPQRIVATALAHGVPHTQADDRETYIASFVDEVLEHAARRGWAQQCDVFVETTAFSADEARQIVGAAAARGLPSKLHVDQLHNGNGAALAAELRTLSADHLDHTTDDGLQKLAQAGVIAGLLPGCSLFLPKVGWPNARRWRDLGCSVAIATDCNPGSSMTYDLPLCATLAATQCGLTLEEALWGITRGGARALGLADRGSLRPGEQADFVVVDHEDWRALLYTPADAPVTEVVVAGEVVLVA